MSSSQLPSWDGQQDHGAARGGDDTMSRPNKRFPRRLEETQHSQQSQQSFPHSATTDEVNWTKDHPSLQAFPRSATAGPSKGGNGKSSSHPKWRLFRRHRADGDSDHDDVDDIERQEPFPISHPDEDPWLVEQGAAVEPGTIDPHVELGGSDSAFSAPSLASEPVPVSHAQMHPPHVPGRVAAAHEPTTAMSDTAVVADLAASGTNRFARSPSAFFRRLSTRHSQPYQPQVVAPPDQNSPDSPIEEVVSAAGHQSNFAPLPRDLSKASTSNPLARFWEHYVSRHINHFSFVYLLLAGTVSGALALYFEAPHASWTGASAVAWFILLSIILAIVPVSLVLGFLSLKLVELLTPKVNKTYRYLLVLHGIHPAVSYLWWAVGVLIAYYSVLLANPAPTRDSQGRIRETKFDDLWWLTRLLILNVMLGILLILRLVVLKKISFGQRTRTYVPLVKETREAEEIIQRLTFDIPPLNLSRKYRRPQPEKRLEEEEAAATKLQSQFRKFLQRKKGVKSADKSTPPVTREGAVDDKSDALNMSKRQRSSPGRVARKRDKTHRRRRSADFLFSGFRSRRSTSPSSPHGKAEKESKSASAVDLRRASLGAADELTADDMALVRDRSASVGAMPRSRTTETKVEDAHQKENGKEEENPSPPALAEPADTLCSEPGAAEADRPATAPQPSHETQQDEPAEVQPPALTESKSVSRQARAVDIVIDSDESPSLASSQPSAAVVSQSTNAAPVQDGEGVQGDLVPSAAPATGSDPQATQQGRQEQDTTTTTTTTDEEHSSSDKEHSGTQGSLAKEQTVNKAQASATSLKSDAEFMLSPHHHQRHHGHHDEDSKQRKRQPSGKHLQPKPYKPHRARTAKASASSPLAEAETATFGRVDTSKPAVDDNNDSASRDLRGSRESMHTILESDGHASPTSSVDEHGRSFRGRRRGFLRRRSSRNGAHHHDRHNHHDGDTDDAHSTKSAQSTESKSMFRRFHRRRTSEKQAKEEPESHKDVVTNMQSAVPHHIPMKPSVVEEEQDEFDASLLLDFAYVRTHYLTACQGMRLISRRAEAERLGTALFDRFAVGGVVQTSTLIRAVAMYGNMFQRNAATAERTAKGKGADSADLSQGQPTNKLPALTTKDQPTRIEDVEHAQGQPMNNAGNKAPPQLTKELHPPSRHHANAGQRDVAAPSTDPTMIEPHNEKEKALVQRVKLLFDPNNVGHIDEEFLNDRCVKIYSDRKKVSLTLRDLDSIVDALGTFLTVAIVVIMLFLLNIVFSTGDLAELTVTVGTTIFALSFIFADSAKNVFNSFIFLFVRHPFDIGDRVHLNGVAVAEPCFVARLELLTTTFRVWDGLVFTVPNHVLYNLQVTNYMRSANMTDKLMFWIDYRTPVAKFEEFERRFFEFMKTKPNDFDPENSAIFIRDLVDTNAMLVGVFTAQRSNWQNAEHVPRKHMEILAIKKILEDLDIRYYPPTQRVKLSESMERF